MTGIDGELPRGGKFKNFETSVGRARIRMVAHRLARTLKWTSGGDPRTRMFHQTRVTAR